MSTDDREKTDAGRRGDGSIYRRGGAWWIQYRCSGRRVREPGGYHGGGARTKTEALEKLRDRLAEIRSGSYIGPAAEALTVADLLDNYLRDIETRGKRSVAAIRSRAECHLNPYFDGVAAVAVTSDRLRQFITDRTAAGLSPASVNRCLQDLRAAFRLAIRENRLLRAPHVPLLREDNVRRGFFSLAEHEAIREHLPEPHGDVADFAYLTGWRRGEIESLTWEQVDLEAGTVSLWTSKNGEARTFPLRDPEGRLTSLGELLARRWAARVFGPEGAPGLSRFVFHVNGRRVWSSSATWREAAKAAGLPGRLFHDYRRSAVRDMIRAGVSQTVAMSVTGHKTVAVFARYNITSDDDKRVAVERLAQHRRASPGTLNVVSVAKRRA